MRFPSHCPHRARPTPSQVAAPASRSPFSLSLPLLSAHTCLDTRAFDTRPTSSDSIRGKPHPGTLSPIISCPSPGSGSCDNSSAPATPTIGRRHRSSALPSPAFTQSMKNEAAPVAMRLHLRPNPRTLTSLPLVFPVSTIYPPRFPPVPHQARPQRIINTRMGKS